MTIVTQCRMGLVVLLLCTMVLHGCGGGGGGSNVPPNGSGSQTDNDPGSDDDNSGNNNKNPGNGSDDNHDGPGNGQDDDTDDPDGGNGSGDNNDDPGSNDGSGGGSDGPGNGNDSGDGDDGSGHNEEEPIHYIPESEFPDRTDLESPLAIPLSGSVGGGSYRLEYAYPELEETLVAPVAITHDGVSDRVFVVGMPGIIYVFSNDPNVQPSEVNAFLDITDRVHSDFNELGLLGLAFDPDYANNGYFYVYYVADNEYSQGGNNNDTVLERWQVDPESPNRALPNSRVRLLSVPQTGIHHKGGTLAFGPDNNLYLSIGDGAWAASYTDNNSSQEMDNLRGTILRIRPDTTAEGGYSIPTDNPFLHDDSVRDEIFAYGFRNPWRFDIDRMTGALWLGDVGQQESNGEAFAYEEVNRILPEDAGANYGWPICEGTMNRGNLGGQNTSGMDCTDELQEPFHAYQHSGASASIIGGVFSDSPSLPSLQGHFLFGDYNRAFVHAVDSQTGDVFEVIAPGRLNHISSFGKDLAGENYVIAFNYPGQGPSGIYRIVESDLQPVEFPQTLSETGLFEDTASLTPAPGVMPYEPNASFWADGAQVQRFVALPAGAMIGYDDHNLWALPEGSAVIKHLSVPVDASGTLRPVNTAILFRQTDQWVSLNYQWNSDQTDATLVKHSSTVTIDTFFDGAVQPMSRSIRESAACASCHSGLKPLGLRTRQLNRMAEFDYGRLNQITEWDRLGLFDQMPGNERPRLTNPENDDAPIAARARAYLDTNCAHCHEVSGGLDLRLETALANTGLLGAPTSVGSARLEPFFPEKSGIYLRQTDDHGRMPVGSRYTNPLAENIFYEWVRAHDAVPADIRISHEAVTMGVDEALTVVAHYVYSNEFLTPVYVDDVEWWSEAPDIVSVNILPDGSATLTAQSSGSARVVLRTPDHADRSLTVTVAEVPPVVALRIFPDAVHLEDEQQLVLLGEQEDGSLVGLTPYANWGIDNNGVAAISSTGQLSRVGEGETRVQATYEGLSTSIPISTHGLPGNEGGDCTEPGCSASNARDIAIRYDNPGNWNNVLIHIWDDNQQHPYGDWPGTPMAGVSEDGWWTFTVAEQHLLNGRINFLFHNGQGQQTGDLNTEQSVSHKGGQLQPWDTGGNTQDNTPHRLTVLGGEIQSNGLSFVGGSVVDVLANEAPLGMEFERWSGDAAAYIVGDPALVNVQLVMPGKPVSLQARYRPANGGTDHFVQTRSDYAADCASCHGANGVGGIADTLNNMHTSGYTLDALAQYIHDTMPDGNAGQCTGMNSGDCAYDMAAMMLANAWQPPSCANGGCEQNVMAEYRNLRLLTRQEYLNSVRDLFRVDYPDSLMSPVPVDGLANNYNTASFLIVDNDRSLGYESVAATVADQAIVEHGFFNLADGCDNNTRCVTRQLGQRVFRRPLSDAEVDTYTALYDAADQGRTLVQALLSSPHYLYRSELGEEDPATGHYRLTPYEVATLLSYTFWATTPDEALLQAASQSELDIRAQVERMLDDPRAERGLRRFASGWLIKAQYDFPAIESSTMAEALNEETIRFVVHAIQENLPYRHLLTADYSIVNRELAEHYEMTPVAGNNWEERYYTDARTGLLGHGSFLASRAGTINPSPIKRGVFVREALLCQEFPTPAAADFNIDRSPLDSNRDAVSRHTSDASCAACHQYIDDVGFGLEAFGSDALFRTHEVIGNGDRIPVISDGAINSLYAPETLLEPGDGTRFQSLPELADLIADSPLSAACYSRQFYRYVAGRHELPQDEAVIRAYSEDLRTGGGLRDMLIDLTLTDNFTLRQ